MSKKVKKITEADINIGTNNGITNVGTDDNKTAGAPANTGIKPPEPNKPAPTKPTGQVGYSTLKGPAAKPADDKSPAAVKSANINKNAQVNPTAEPVKEEVTPETTDMYVEYVQEMQGEEPFMAGGKKYQYVWAKYPDGKKDVGVYAYAGDVCYSNDYFRNTILNLKEDVSEDSTESSTQKPIKFAIAYIENGKKSWLIKIDNNRTDWDWAERPFKLESNVMKFNSFEEANNIAKHMRSPSHKVIVVDSNGKQYTNDGVTEESNLKGGYVKSKLKEDAFSTNGDTSGTDDVSKALGGIKGTEAVTRLIQKLKQTPDLVNLMKNIKTPEDKQIVAVELDKMLNLPATTIPRVGKALNTVIGAEDKLNVSKTAAESVNAKMSKANIIEFVNKLKPRRAVKEKVTIKELNEKSIPMNVKSFKAKLDELSTKPSEEFNSNNSWGFGGAAGTKYHIGNLVVKVAVATQRHTGNFPFITITDVDGRRIFDEEQNSKTFAIALNTINKLLNK